MTDAPKTIMKLLIQLICWTLFLSIPIGGERVFDRLNRLIFDNPFMEIIKGQLDNTRAKIGDMVYPESTRPDE